MEKLGFNRIWICWIMSFVSTVTYTVLLNGKTHGFLKPEKSIHQGDPLSSFLFILCAEALVNCLNHVEESGRLHGIKIATSAPSVHHLLFADDSLLLCQVTRDEGAELMRWLKCYGIKIFSHLRQPCRGIKENSYQIHSRN